MKKLLILIVSLIFSVNSLAIEKSQSIEGYHLKNKHQLTDNLSATLSAQYLPTDILEKQKMNSPVITAKQETFIPETLAFNDMPYSKVNGQKNTLTYLSSNKLTTNIFSLANTQIKEINARYHTPKFIIELDYLNNIQSVKKNEMITLKSAFTVWSYSAFNLAINGEVSMGNRDVINQAITNNHYTTVENDYILYRSLSVSGTYLFNKSWALTGSVSSNYLNDELTQRLLNNQGSDKVATIGTTYSF